WTGGIANQNRGTIGGNIVNASPAADSLPALLVYEAELLLVSVGGERRVPYTSFYINYKRTQLARDGSIRRSSSWPERRQPRRSGRLTTFDPRHAIARLWRGIWLRSFWSI